MKPEDIVLQLKRNGTFDDIRNRLFADFQAKDGGSEPLMSKIREIMEQKTAQDTSLLMKERGAFHDAIIVELERAGIFESVRRQVLDSLLQQDDYQRRIDQEIRQVMEKSQGN